MGLIVPRKNALANTKTLNKKILTDCIVQLLNETDEDEQGIERSNAMMVARRVLNTAKYAESNKDSTSAAKLLWEYSYGKPAIVADEEQEELPEIAIRVHPKDAEQIKMLAQTTEIAPEPQDKIIVDIEGEDGEMEF